MEIAQGPTDWGEELPGELRRKVYARYMESFFSAYVHENLEKLDEICPDLTVHRRAVQGQAQ
jgi:hypothetical protein